MLSTAINQIKELYSVYLALLVLAIGIFTYYVDLPYLKKQKLKKEQKIAKVIGVLYIVAGPLIYVALRFI